LLVLAGLGALTLALENRLGMQILWKGPSSTLSALKIPLVEYGPKPGKVPPLAPLDVNRAGFSQLRWVPGIGPATARKIILYRKAHGPFQSLADLKSVPGIGEKKFSRMASYLVLSPSGGPGGAF
jgi:competence ComEA-like helix-hairpin-helix protein